MSAGGPVNTQTQSAPEYLQPYLSGLLQYGQQAALQPYTPYSGPRIAEQSPLYQYGAEQLANQTASPYTDAAGAAAAGAYDRLAASSSGPTYSEQYGQPGTDIWTQPGIAGAYMNPYITGVLDIQMREADRQAQQALQGIRADSAARGAFGGSRSAIMESEWNRNNQQNLSDIYSKGLNTAYEQGRAQFNADEARQLEAWKAGASQWTNEQGAAAASANAAQGLGGLLASIGDKDFATNRQIIQDVMNLGLSEEGRRQKELDMDYQDFQTQRDYPWSQLEKYAGIVYGTPFRTSDQAQYQAPPNWLTQMAGIGSLLWGGTK